MSIVETYLHEFLFVSTRGRHGLRRAREFALAPMESLERTYLSWITYFDPPARAALLTADAQERLRESPPPERFLEGLSSPQPATVRLCLSALEHLPNTKDGPTVLALVQALRRLPDGKEEQRKLRNLVSNPGQYNKKRASPNAPAPPRAQAQRAQWPHPPRHARSRAPDRWRRSGWRASRARTAWASRGQVALNAFAIITEGASVAAEHRGATIYEVDKFFPTRPDSWCMEAHLWHCHRCRRSIWCLAPDTGLE